MKTDAEIRADEEAHNRQQLDAKAGFTEGMRVRVVDTTADGSVVPLSDEALKYKGAWGEIVDWNDVEHTWKVKMESDGKEQFFHIENLVTTE